MSDMYDYDEIHDLHDPGSRKQTKRWTQKNGKKIRICDMDDQHLRNSIKMLRRKAIKMRDGVSYPMFNGDIAQFHAEQGYDNMMEMDDEELADEFCPIHEYLMFEYRRRKLSKEDL